ncbi:MAG: cell division protein FtsA [Candidatus Peregrinibacteria bacterium GW2011_GWE2_39_6]|nr:MAG: cell division protein FtsA [Candidatus Peregrinibacteria bacterium GW2011_GWF2_39_17]KKR26697.1 MAG: cell division protein FtsA [Candidatus Peregrinibacteria bacterium GW2011_GWE2_39_6]HCW32938.1 hypothetical protein [Candidatus Peregrinibacteria bacterium]
MFHWLRRKTRYLNDTFLALDIGTEFIKAVIIKIEPPNGQILGIGKIRQNLDEMQNGMITDIAGVIRNCKKAIAIAEEKADIKPHQLILGIAGELIKGATRTIHYRRPQPQAKIHLEELKNIIHKVQWKAFEQIRSEIAHETGQNEIDIKLINASIMDIKIDGYKIANPLGFQGKEVTINIFNAFSPLTHYGVLQSITAELNIDLLAMTAEPYALTSALTQKSKEFFNVLIMDIGGGTTDIALIQDGILEGTKMFTLGGRSFTKRLANSLNVSFLEAEEIKLAYAENRLEKQSHKIVAKSLNQDCDMWLTGVSLTLSEFLNETPLPPKILLCGGGCLLPEIKTMLTEGTWWKNLSFIHKPVIQFAEPQLITTLTDKNSYLKGAEYVTPASLAYLGMELKNEEKILGQILRKVVRLMQV